MTEPCGTQHAVDWDEWNEYNKKDCNEMKRKRKDEGCARDGILEERCEED